MTEPGPEPEPIVSVVDDDEAMCESLGYLLRSAGLCARTFTSAAAFLADFRRERPGCVVLDVRMPGMSGLELHAQLAREAPGLPVILLTGHGDIPMAVRSVQAGALDFLEKPVNDGVLIRRIRAALELDRGNRERQRQQAQLTTLLATLTDRERDVMELIVAGRANKQIAADLGIREKTVEVHRKHVLDKMRVRTAVELVHVTLAIRRGEAGGAA